MLCGGIQQVAVYYFHGRIISNFSIRRMAVQPVVQTEFSIKKCSINMVLIGDLWSRARSTAPPAAQWQSGSEAAEGPEAVPWTGDRRRWPEDAAPGGR